ncbi:MAG: phosphoribosylformylglycinamidine synthase subunit PurS [Actinomycetota bacterium]|nr:phosphoribosylformylglycinamidine synthase subunit PurS [Actinomycetota bacterium]
MTAFTFEVLVSLKPGLLDPQGKAVEGSLPAMGFDNVAGVRVGKHIRLTVEAPDEATAMAQVHEMATRLLSNPVIEDYEVSEAAAT